MLDREGTAWTGCQQWQGVGRKEESASMKDSWVLGAVSRGSWGEMTKAQTWTSEEAIAGERSEQMGLL